MKGLQGGSQITPRKRCVHSVGLHGHGPRPSRAKAEGRSCIAGVCWLFQAGMNVRTGSWEAYGIPGLQGDQPWLQADTKSAAKHHWHLGCGSFGEV